ncbi:MAG: hypothetical protein FWE03_03355 [Firmicutes bacterium]|nr:hypothetical protein [Bacillota bacterium]
MDNQIKQLIDTFIEYRNLLTPIQKNLSDFLGSYEEVKTTIEKLSLSFEGDLQKQLLNMFDRMEKEAKKATELSSQIDKLASSTDKYSSAINMVINQFNKIEIRLGALLDIDKRADEQLAKIENIIEDRSRSYNVKELSTALDGYNKDIKRVSEFLNKDVADVMIENGRQLSEIKKGMDSIVKEQGGEDLKELLITQKTSANFLKKIVEDKDINEAYLFEVLDRWAEDRKVKVKK